MAGPDTVLLISASGRALAASAARAALPVIVLDLFNDLDTQAMARHSARCANARGGFSRVDVLEQMRRLAPPEGYAACVVGSGLEARPLLMRQLVGRVPYAGNAPECIARIKDPQWFFDLLSRLDIPFPETRMAPPAQVEGWLSKRGNGSGGLHVRPAHLGWPRRERRYFQRHLGGRVISALFLADGADACIVGFSALWTHTLSPRQPFAYGGACSVHDLDPEIQQRMVAIVRHLVVSAGLRGLNGIDFILEGSQPKVLELNPRPTATIDLHDERVQGGLLRAHLAACRGVLPAQAGEDTLPRAHALLWAARSLVVPATMQWPDWVSDVPAPGALIAAGRPVCTVHGDGPQAAQDAMARMHAIAGELYALSAGTCASSIASMAQAT